MKAHSSHSSHSNTQNGLTCHDKNLKESNGVAFQNSLSQKSQPAENDNIPEEVSAMQTKYYSNYTFSFKRM